MRNATLTGGAWSKKNASTLTGVTLGFFSLILWMLAGIQLSYGQVNFTAEQKAAGLVPQPVDVPYYGAYPSVEGAILSAEERGLDGCYIPHDPETWTNAGEFAWGQSDDGSSSLINLPFTFDLYGQSFNSLYINVNGNVSFGTPYGTFSPVGFPSGSYTMVAPFWADVDLRPVTGELWYYVTPTAMYVNWVEVGYYSNNTDKLNTFQLIITNGNDPVIGVGNNVAFHYQDMAWTTGDASGGVNGFGGSPATVGVNAGNGVDFFQFGRFDHAGLDYDGPGGNADGVDYLDNQCFQFSTSDANNIPPIAQNFPNNNTVTLCIGETVNYSFGFIGPEINQTVSVVVNGSGDGFNVNSNNSGNPAIVNVTIEGLSEGSYQIIFVSTDDYENPASSTIVLNVVVEDCGGECDPSLNIECPADITVECGSELHPDLTGYPAVFAECLDFDIELDYSDVVDQEGLCSQTIIRTWYVYAGQMMDFCTQIITVVDSEGPEFINFPANVEVDCVEDVPAPGEVSAEDACTSVVDIDIFTSETGNPTDSCVTTTAFGPGADWAIWLPSLQTLGFADSQNWNWSAGGYFIEYNDGTARLYGTIANSANANQIFEVDFWFENKRDWAAWSGLGRSYKDDLNLATPGALYEDWTYYELVGGFSTMTGMGEFAGSNLYFYHMPSNYYFGFQCGWAANNKNANFGMSGWFTFEGTMNGEYVEGHGDVNVDKSCEPVNLQECPNDTQFTYFWRAEDACGNVTIASQTITVWDDVAPIFTEFPADETIECDEEIPAIGVVVAEDNCEGDVTVLGPTEVIIPGECPQAYTIVRTWAAIDECQNRFDRSQNIYVVDTTDPEFTFVPEEVTYECDEEIAVIMAEASDNCDLEVTVTYEDEMVETEDDCPQSYDIIRTFTAVDDCGNEAMVSVTIHVVDTTAPVFGDYTIYTSIECTEDITVPGPEATDNCGEVTLTYEDQLQSGGCLGVIVRTWTAEDECGNTSETEQYITLLDTTPPVIENPADATIECDEVTAAPEIEIYDNCGYEVEVEFSEVITPGECEDSYTITWTWTATDYCENVATATTVITVQDTTDPIFTWFPNDSIVECDMPIPAVVYPIAEDNCDDMVDIELTVMEEPGSCPQNYTIMRIFRGFDNCGNETMRVQTITVQDTTAPEFPELGSLTYECNTEIPVILPDATDNCGEVTVTYADGPSMEGECPQEYSFVRTYTATDECDNSSTATQTIYVVDTTAPVITGEIEIELPCDNYESIEITATDNCGEVSIDYNDTPVSGGCAGRIIRLYSVSDECGNVSEFEQIITLTDEVAPVWTLFPADVTVECDEVPSNDGVEVDYYDNCTEVELSYNGEVRIDGNCPHNYILERTWTITDNCGNATPRTWTITVQDTEAPIFTEVAADVTIECDQEVPAPFAAAEDNCGEVSIEVSPVITEGECANEYVMVRTYTATDECGNSSTATQTITVVDTTAPEFTAFPEMLTFECDEEVVYQDPTATDNCGDASVVATNYDLYTPFIAVENGDGTVDLTNAPETIILNGSNSDTEQYVAVAAVTVVKPVILSFNWEYSSEDEDGPAFDPFGYTVNGEFFQLSDDNGSDEQSGSESVALNAGDVFAFVQAATDDQLGNASTIVSGISFEAQELECPIVECYIRGFVATDACGNMSYAYQFIVIEDTTAPVITGEIEIELPCDNYDSIEITATDNCSEVEISYNDTPVSGGCAGRIIRLYTVTDQCDNTSTFEQIITLTDEVAPEFTVFPSDVTVECTEVPTGMPGIQYTDNCTAVELSYDGEVIIEGNCDGNYVIERTWTITDNCDNSTSRTWTITVEDTTAPYWTWVPEGGSFSCDEEIVYGEATAADLCSGATVDYSDVTIPGECPQSYTIVRTWTAVDGCGNAAESVSAEYHVYDEEAPVFGDYSDLSFECDEEVVYQDPTATDNCGTATVVCTNQIIEGNCPQNYTIVRTCVATDECGNASTVVYNIEVLDTTAPVITGEIEIELPCDNYQGIYISATDNCGEVSYDYNDTPVSGGCAGRIIRHYTVSDECGNSSEFEQFITLTDEVAPVADYVPASFTVECDEEYALEDAQFSDNCDDNLEILPASSITPQDCGYIITRTWTAVDHCDNETTVSQTITVVDTTAPTSEFENGAVTIECNTDILIEEPVFTDNCDEELTIVPSVETTPGSCDANYTVVYTWTAYDDCNNSATRTFSVTYVDTTAPYWTSVPQGGEYSCTDVLPNAQATASDYCSDVTVDVSDAITPGDCPAEYVLVRTWTAVDACGNEAEPVSAEYHVYDNQAPTILTDLQDVWVECAGDVPSTPELEVADNCSTFTIDVDTDVMEEDECGNYYAEVTYTVVDACGNTSYASYTINVYDETAPVFECEVEDLVLDCEADVPTPAICEATDNCGGEVTVEYSEEIIGEMTPEEGATATCVLSTPAGPFCDGNDPWSVHFFGLPQGYDFFTTVEGTFTEFENGTAHIQATVVSTINPNAGLIVDVWFENGLSWEDFIAQPGAQNYKDDCNLAGDDYLDWTYYIMTAGSATLIGTGDLAGTTLNLSHAPASHYYGYQVGHAANNVNGNYGNGGWFTANGTLQLGQESYDIVNKSGDFAFEQDCCPQYQIIRTWTATDCTGNTTVIEQNISFADLGFGAPNLPEMEEAMDHDKGQIDITRIYPNPALETAWIEYGSDKATAAELKIFDMKGNEVATIYKGMLEAGVKYRNEVRVSDLESGIYMVVFTSQNDVKIERMVVTK